jgi:hypothetical protein
MDTFEEFIGKTVKDIVKENDSFITIKFTDESSISIGVDSVNISCWCHPEYEYYLDIETHL